MPAIRMTRKGKALVEAFAPAGVTDPKERQRQAFRTILETHLAGMTVGKAAEFFAESFGSEWFPSVTLDAVNKAMVEGYGSESIDFVPLTKAATARDFRTNYAIAVGAMPNLDKVIAGAPYQEVFVPDEQASWSIAKYGNLFSLNMEAIADDELGALLSAVRDWGSSAARTTNDWFWQTNFEDNPTLYDGVVLFHTSHSNTDSSSPLNEANLRTGIAKMRRQTGRNGEVLRLMPKFLIVPPELADLAERLVKSPTLIVLDQGATANEVTGSVNTIAGHGIQVIVSPYLTATGDWYLAANRPGFTFGRYRGQPGGPQTFREAPNTGAEFERDAMRFKVRDFWGGTWHDYRMVYKGVA